MIREYAPIGLIPAAWALTFATIYPGISSYWIQHMHYFMILFLAVFTVLSWRQMRSDPVLDIWRKVIGAGIIFTGLGASSFILNTYTWYLAFSSLAYWFIAPGIGLYISSGKMEENSGLYRNLAGESMISFGMFCLGLYTEVFSLQVLGLVGVAVAQTWSIVVASRMDQSSQK